MKDNILEASEEQLLAAYLNSRGINAKFVTKDTKIAHAKSAQYAKWKADHWDRFTKEEVEHIEEKKLTSLQKFRKASAEREKKHAEIEKQSKEKPDMKGAIDRLEKHLNKEEASITDIKHNGKTIGVIRHDGMGEYTGSHWDSKQNWSSRDRKELVSHIKQYHQRHLNKEATDAGISKAKETSFHKKLDKLVHSTFGKRKDEMKMKEETVSEVYATGVQGHVSQAALDSIKGKRSVKVNLGTPSYNPKPKTLAKKPSKKASFISKLLNREDTYQDSYAATQTTGMEIADLPPEEKVRKREMSKSARMIKALYKKHKVVKEELYDHEKEDKSVATYGKKPTMVKAEKKLGMAENQPQAAAVLTGGKTLTGQTRDTLEIDPLMRKPGPPIDQKQKSITR